MSNVPNQLGQQQQINLQVRYDETSIKYANQVLVNAAAEEVFLEFSPGIVADRQMGGAILPIHTRVVMTPTGVLRLYQALGQALQNYQVIQTQPQQQQGQQDQGQAAGDQAASASPEAANS